MIGGPLMCAAGVLREGFLSGFDNSRMENVWPDKEYSSYK